jgi:two-component system alkaline phosphatase synthesis response regulator PhoP
MATILIIEDEPELVRVIQSYLEKAGYRVLSAMRGNTGLTLWESHQPDLVILDLNLPGMDGLDVARAIRKTKDTPIIMLTARVEEPDRLVGLELGADDYITKPFSPREVVARVKAVLRRVSQSEQKARVIKAGNLIINLDNHEVTRDGLLLELTPTEFSLLSVMMAHPGRVHSRMQLLEASQGTAYEGYERTIDAHIKNMRAKVEIDPHKPEYIETIFGLGYRFRRVETEPE